MNKIESCVQNEIDKFFVWPKDIHIKVKALVYTQESIEIDES